MKNQLRQVNVYHTGAAVETEVTFYRANREPKMYRPTMTSSTRLESALRDKPGQPTVCVGPNFLLIGYHL